MLAAGMAILLVACANDGGSGTRDTVVTQSTVCLATAEPAAFACSGGTAARVGDTLRIHLPTNDARLFVNTNGEVDSTYQYLGRLGPRGVHLVEQFGGEHPPFFVLVQPHSGRVVTATGMPALSPDSTHFAAATPEWDCAESPDQRLAIWRFTDSLPVREWEMASLVCGGDGATSGWAALEPVWRARDTLSFTVVEQPSGSRRAGLVVWDRHAWLVMEPRR
jgi:hypothetical protein